jgi:predicted RNase H-like nuclease (RuvC/YqgF family)
MDSLFRDSGLMRPKWDEVHYADGSTYGAKTIQRAICRTTEFYDPEESPESSPADESDREDPPTAPASAENTVQNTQPTSVYLEEQNRVLRQRVRDQEETIEQQAKHIEELEDEVKQLQATLTDRDMQVETSTDRSDPSPAGLWERVRQRFWDDHLK